MQPTVQQNPPASNSKIPDFSTCSERGRKAKIIIHPNIKQLIKEIILNLLRSHDKELAYKEEKFREGKEKLKEETIRTMLEKGLTDEEN